VRLRLSVIAYNLGNLWWRLVLPRRIDGWSLTSLQHDEALRESPCPEEAELASIAGLPESFGMERMKKTLQRRRLGVEWMPAKMPKRKSSPNS
jgi:hypothetical protein